MWVLGLEPSLQLLSLIISFNKDLAFGLHVSLQHMCAVPTEAKRGPCGFWERNPGLVQEKLVLLTAAPSLQLLSLLCTGTIPVLDCNYF